MISFDRINVRWSYYNHFNLPLLVAPRFGRVLVADFLHFHHIDKPVCVKSTSYVKNLRDEA